ncbi:MAG TPA: carbohydrate kinase family protein [Sphaerochaeta sp.]|nr:carbohydrate kinase family protein [Sphaerochaeta sp.]
MKIGALGCCLIDYLYTENQYSHDRFRQLSSITAGDGGLIGGGLVFAEDLEKFAGSPFGKVFESLIDEKAATSSNLGGPAIISLIHVSQLLGSGHAYHFNGVVGDDDVAKSIRLHVEKTLVEACFITQEQEKSPTTYVLNDNRAANGKGERSFINVIGAANHFDTTHIDDGFYKKDIVVFGGTALVPNLHEQIDIALVKAKAANAMTIVGTIYDFKNQKKNPTGRWPFGKENGYSLTDLLVCDAHEALRMSGEEHLMSAASWLMESGVGAFIITHGPLEIIAWSSASSYFGANELAQFPVCTYVDDLIHADPSLRKDTTGCGDNFLGGVIASICMQREQQGSGELDLNDCIIWGGASGGFALMHHGGFYHEDVPGEKFRRLEPIVDAYRKQLTW